MVTAKLSKSVSYSAYNDANPYGKMNRFANQSNYHWTTMKCVRVVCAQGQECGGREAAVKFKKFKRYFCSTNLRPLYLIGSAPVSYSRGFIVP